MTQEAVDSAGGVKARRADRRVRPAHLRPFEFEGITATGPDRTFEGELTLDVGGREVRPDPGRARAHRGRRARARSGRAGCSTPATSSSSAAPRSSWAGPIDRWIAALERILDMDLATIVPGTAGHREDRGRGVREYLVYVQEQARKRFEDGLVRRRRHRHHRPRQVGDMPEHGRLAQNVINVYQQLDPSMDRPERMTVLGRIAKLEGFPVVRRGRLMRFVTYVSPAGDDRVGVVDGDPVHGFEPGVTLLDVLERRRPGRRRRARRRRARRRRWRWRASTLRAPLQPRSMRDCVGFLQHLRNCSGAAGPATVDDRHTPVPGLLLLQRRPRSSARTTMCRSPRQRDVRLRARGGAVIGKAGSHDRARGRRGAHRRLHDALRLERPRPPDPRDGRCSWVRRRARTPPTRSARCSSRRDELEPYRSRQRASTWR